MKHDNIIFPKPNIASHFIVHKSYNYSFWHVINNFLLHVYSLPLVDMPIFSARCLPELWRNQSFFCESRETRSYPSIYQDNGHYLLNYSVTNVPVNAVWLLREILISSIFSSLPSNNLGEVPVHVYMCYLLERCILYSSMYCVK